MGCDAITDDEISLLKEIAKCKKLLKAAKDDESTKQSQDRIMETFCCYPDINDPFNVFLTKD